MGRDDDERRRAAITSVLACARRAPQAGLPYEQLPSVTAVFADRRELLLALQYEWSRALWERIEVRSRAGGLPAAEVAQPAWDDCATRHPVLRRLLDTYRDELCLVCGTG
jgi:hypothetical protein